MAMQLGHVHIKTREDPQKVAKFYAFSQTALRKSGPAGNQFPAQSAKKQS